MATPFLKILKGEYTIHRFEVNEMVIPEILDDSFYSFTKSDDEISIVCNSEIVMNDSRQEPGWKIIKLIGPFDFTEVGIIAAITKTLADKQIGVFVVSTFDTDFVLIKEENLENSVEALKQAGYSFIT